MPATLWHIELSHYSEKARWALDYKGIPHRLRAPMPGPAKVAVALALSRGRSQRFPILQLDGRAVPGSNHIVAAVEEHTPDPPLYPSDPGERAKALELERFFDDDLAPEVRRFGWQHMMQDGEQAARALFGDRHPVQRRLMKAGMPMGRAMIRADYGVSAEAADTARGRIEEAMERIESELDGGDYLVGGSFSVADLAGAALLTPILLPPERPYAPDRAALPAALAEFSDKLAARPAGQWVFETYRRHRGARAKVAS